MTPTQFRAIIDELGLSQAATAKLLGTHERTARRWATGEQDIPTPVQICLRLMLEFEIEPSDVEEIMSGDHDRNN